ncbi:anhydro-N-acetylmuramic acid kinase [Magnetovibrio sp.]|uniref:anhydro-N-acetylmuramic acid kinase n=1 Tax=Magnetovibrio sp. TaxID=2024836 RepID=UPI002F92BC62
MNTAKIYTAVGLMSGTSMDGIDVALIITDGEDVVEFGPSLTVPYEDEFKDRLRRVLGPAGRAAPGAKDVERNLTILHAEAVKRLLSRANLEAEDIDVVGFHGHTVHHDPKNAITVQLGEGSLLADWLGIPVVSDFRSRDVNAGGEGAPLVPVFHAALLKSAPDIELPAAVLNIGGVSNVTWVGDRDGGLIAFDTGPGNAPLNEWVLRHTGADLDKDGTLAAAGTVNEEVLAAALAHEFFDRKPPKSLDRQEFCHDCAEGLGLEDGAATITAFIARASARAAEHFPEPATTWIVTGGGRLNPVLMKHLREATGADVRSADGVGWDGDAMEAQAFAYLAVRAQRWLPITFPATTGVSEPMSGGQLHQPS